MTREWPGVTPVSTIGYVQAALAHDRARRGADVTVLLVSEGTVLQQPATVHLNDRLHLVHFSIPNRPSFSGPSGAHHIYQRLIGDPWDELFFVERGGDAYCVVQAKYLGLGFRNSRVTVAVHGPTVWSELSAGRPIADNTLLERDWLERQSVALADRVVLPSTEHRRWLRQWEWTSKGTVEIDAGWLESAGSHSSAEHRPHVHPVFGIAFIVSAGHWASAVALRRALIQVTRSGVITPDRLAIEFRQTEFSAPVANEWMRLVRQSCPDIQQVDAQSSAGGDPAWLPCVMPSSTFYPHETLQLLRTGRPFVVVSPEPMRSIRPSDRAAAAAAFDADSIASLCCRVLAGGVRSPYPATPNLHTARLRGRVTTRPRALERNDPRWTPKVSVIIGTLNRPRALLQAVDSIRAQTYPEIELIVIDDGSDAGDAMAVLDALAGDFEARTWKILRRQPGASGLARNMAAALATGEWLLFMDDDNVAKPEEVDVFVRAAVHSGADILVCGYDAFEGQGSAPPAVPIVQRWMPFGAALPIALLENRVGDANMCVRRAVFTKLGGFAHPPGSGMLEDWGFLLKAMAAGVSVEVVPECLYFYRRVARPERSLVRDNVGLLAAIGPLISTLRPAERLLAIYAAALPRAVQRRLEASTQQRPPDFQG
ncbi:MAG: glycosyltransferase family 2 protein [Acidobacteriota bacterium]